MRPDEPAVGFYWTLPVPWVGFTALPNDVDEAATLSRTIRYQRDLIRRYAKDHGLTLVHEAVFLEVAPDRGTQYVKEALRKVEAICRTHHAVLLFVDFSDVQGWRSHGPMQDWSGKAQIEIRPIYPDPISIEGKGFDPHKHFSDWREQQHAWTNGKEDREVERLSRASGLRADGLSYAKIAAAMNEANELNLTGKRWTAENLRKFLAKQSAY